MKRLMYGAATTFSLVTALAATAAMPGETHAQVAPPTPPAAHPPLEIGAVAPDFELPGATRYGVLDRPVKLSDYKGEIVVLAFFFKARTKG